MALPDPDELIWYTSKTIYGQSIKMSRRTAAHLDWTKAELAREHPGAALLIIQGCYNTGVAASAGTHDYDAVLDVYIPGWSFSETQKFLRRKGWAAWWRYPPLFSSHVHMVSLGYTTRVGIYVPGQVSDYYAHKTGLVGHYSDSSWHPADIAATVFQYFSQSAPKEDDMPTPQDLLAAKIGGDATVKDALNAILDLQHAMAEMRQHTVDRDNALADQLDAVMAEVKDDATRTQLAKVRERLVEVAGTHGK